MKKLLLITIILLIQSFSSFGEWKKVGSNNDGEFFINSDTIIKNKDLIYFDFLQNFFEPNIESSLSLIGRDVMNCKSKKYRSLRWVYYFELMGKGKVVSQITFSNKEMLDIDVTDDLFYNFFCK